jgi:hypothetical protein
MPEVKSANPSATLGLLRVCSPSVQTSPRRPYLGCHTYHPYHPLLAATVRFAERHLFAPLGIVNYAWTHRLYGREDVPIEVELASRDFAKLGQLYLDGGIWQGKRIISEEWISQSTVIHTRTNEANLRNPNYSYLWSRHSFEAEGEEIQGFQLRVREDSFCSYFRN